ncbi:hypothetical protein ACFOTA_06900 [Chitinophaga sp. GCM10012297]|uniref:Uncharacterized protein n=1 Tax=Chitinophaga chungangae TaxID=2821488 RepID=A0ABS3YB72_9BACT|nr:hypothetical protein [Chitinophaga chungangae]MBO9151927.1 hypothetical protein [Chitinophaga chungangae]
MKQTKKDFIEWQEEQLNAGKRKTGGRIKPEYRPATKAIKRKKGQPTDRVTLKDTGFFHASLFLVVGQNDFGVVSTDRKGPWLVDKYGESIFGLGGVFKIGYIDDLQPVFIDKIRESLHL